MSYISAHATVVDLNKLRTDLMLFKSILNVYVKKYDKEKLFADELYEIYKKSGFIDKLMCYGSLFLTKDDYNKLLQYIPRLGTEKWKAIMMVKGIEEAGGYSRASSALEDITRLNRAIDDIVTLSDSYYEPHVFVISEGFATKYNRIKKIVDEIKD